MITRDDLRRWAAIRHDAGVVTAYVGSRRRLMHETGHRVTAFKGACKRFLESTEDAHARAALDREQPRILALLENQRTTEPGLMVLACEPEGLWEVHPLQVRVPTRIHVEAAPQTALLAGILDDYESMAIVAVQRDKARIFLSEQAESESGATVLSEVHRRHSSGGWSQARFQRHVEVQVAEHWKKVVSELERLAAQRPFRRLVLGGTSETTKAFVEMLPKPLADTVIGTFPVDVKQDTDDAVVAKAREVFDAHERESESRKVQELFDAAGAGGAGVIGLDGTVAALLEGRVRTLLVADGAAADGAVCPQCDYFAAKPFDRCPLCGNEAETPTDVVEVAVERAVLSGADVESLLGEARDTLRGRGHEVGALLRY